MYNLTYLKFFNLYLVAGLVSFSLQSAQVETYGSRAELTTNPVARRLFNIMETKQTNLVVAADVADLAYLTYLANMVGPEICALKVHADIVEDFDLPFTQTLQEIAKMHDFLIIEDRKFADIGDVVKKQYTGGVHHIADWADAVIAHAISGPDIIKALEQASVDKQRGMFLIAELSSSGNLTKLPGYADAVIKMAEENPFVIGLIAQTASSTKRSLIKCTPGVNLTQTGDALGQNYNSPEHVIKNGGSDVIIVGRGIYEAKTTQELLAAARRYRTAGWIAYQERIQGANHWTLEDQR